MLISLKSVEEDKVGKKWQKCFNKSWPYYKNWYVQEGLLATSRLFNVFGAIGRAHA